jgi:hypothetical protein
MAKFYERTRSLVLRVLKVPPEPHPPAGSPGSLQVFRAGTNHYRMLLAFWAVRQVFVILGILFGLWLASQLLQGNSWFPEGSPPARFIAAQQAWIERWHLVGWLAGLEILGVLTALVSALVGYTVMRLQFEMHWYLVTDRSLRIREGVKRVREMTLSFANIQQIEVRQGPIQRLLGLADVVVTTAGGGSRPTHGNAQGFAEEPCHVGILRSVDRAEEIRNLMLDRLRELKSAGLGDPDDAPEPLPAVGSCEMAVGSMAARSEVGRSPGLTEPLAAARELLEEARSLRRALTGPSPAQPPDPGTP